MTGKIINWTAAEITKVCEYFLRYRTPETQSSTLAGFDEQDIRAAQQLLLPIDRHIRKPNMSKLRPLMKAEFMKGQKLAAQQKLNADKADRAQLVERLNRQVRPVDTEQRPKLHVTAVPEAVRKRKPTIAILGPKPTQAQSLERMFPEFNITFYENNCCGLGKSLKGCDRVLAMTGKMSSQMEDSALKAVDRRRYSRASGGTTGLSRKIAEWRHMFLTSPAAFLTFA
jgi:hypothetical protein